MATDVLLFAAWFGLVTGLLEGVEFLTFQKLAPGNPTSHLRSSGSPPSSTWLLFGTCGIGPDSLAAYPFPGSYRSGELSIWVSAFLALLSWLAVALTEHLSHYALVLLAIGVAVQFTSAGSATMRPPHCDSGARVYPG